MQEQQEITSKSVYFEIQTTGKTVLIELRCEISYIKYVLVYTARCLNITCHRLRPIVQYINDGKLPEINYMWIIPQTYNELACPH